MGGGINVISATAAPHTVYAELPKVDVNAGLCQASPLHWVTKATKTRLKFLLRGKFVKGVPGRRTFELHCILGSCVHHSRKRCVGEDPVDIFDPKDRQFSFIRQSRLQPARKGE